MNLSQAVKQKAIELGFDLVGITTAEPIEIGQTEHISDWLKEGLAGRMEYMRKNFEKRTNPALLLKGAQSVICVGLNYKPPACPPPPQAAGPVGIVANFALYQDYHDFMKDRLHQLADFISNSIDTPCRFKCCVDSAPLAERALAERAGLGFIGKNHMLINPRLGPQILLAELITDIKLTPDQPVHQTCSGCDKCISACPTGALRPDGNFDANKCISYLTIEYAGEIPADLAEKMGAHLFGCDECILACPYNENTPACANKDFKFHGERKQLDLQKLLQWDEQAFNTELAGSSLIRTGLERLKRNARICLNNTI
jgi:epoxyqueuosine reductase